ncbi:Spherulation-specific family 4 [Lineolata rhizophorae]|uniref:Spherulation-specific family 4 n=1 Tax=Lineolata rhizophorae TaxID=578093 RepID=A0A6A6P2K2_9PEZI|nr:Spherulation-specific family 4 [Lineolata rhizophorae]
MENASREISTYAGWADQNQSLALDGVFLDETPNEYEAPRAELLTNIRSEVESTAGLGTYIVHNPGMVPDPRYMESADLTVVFEEAYRTFENQNSNTVSRVRDLQQDRQDLCMLVHSVPDSEMEGDQLHELVDQLQDLAGSIFLTNLAVDYYHSFSSQFGDFVRAI